MVKSPSCFKIITCGKDSVEGDDLEVTQEKGLSDKRGWSFRKKSTRNRVLSNTVTADSPTLGNKERSESATVNFESQSDPTISDKISVLQCNDEKPHLETYLKPEVLETVVIEEVPDKTALKEEVPETAAKSEESDSVVVKEEVPETAAKLEEPDAVVVAEEEVLETAVKPEEPKSLVNEGLPETVVAKEEPDDLLVAGENEHRSDAKIDESAVIVIQTAARGFLARRELRKLKKLVKLQAAVRGHIVRRHAVGTLRCVQAIVKMQSLVRARHARLSTEPDLKNETLVKKSSGSNTSMEKLLGNRFAQQMLDSTPKTKPIHVKCDPSKTDSAWKWLERWTWASSDNAVSEPKKVVAVTDNQENEKNVKFDDSLQEVEPDIICESAGSKCRSVHESTAPSESEDNLIIYEAGKFDFQTMTSLARENSEQPEFENASTSDIGDTASDLGALTSKYDQARVDSRTHHESPCEDPEVVAEQPKHSMEILASEELEEKSKFEELAEESHKEVISSEAQSVILTQEISKAESPVHWLRNRVAGSECGTELSVTSTLDSPDRSEIVAMEHVPEAKVSEEVVCNFTTKANNSENVLSDKQEKLDNTNIETVTPVVSEELPKVVEPNPETPNPQKEKKHETRAQQVEAASPTSHVTVPESQGTPSSQVSVKTEKRKSGLGKKRASLSSSIKKSPPSTTKHENSGSRSNTIEKQLLKEQKSAKRRNTFGSPKPENGEQEPRDSNGSEDRNTNIPHFMEATQSARAKLNAAAANSPRSSPDVGEGETILKKRHSFPAAASNGRQGSPPRAQRSKGNNERKWQR